jgi:hypothetical protein
MRTGIALIAALAVSLTVPLRAQPGHDALAGVWVLVPESTPYQGSLPEGTREGGRRGGFGGGGRRGGRGGGGGGGFGGFGGGGGRGGGRAGRGGGDNPQATADFMRSLTDAQKQITVVVHEADVSMTDADGVEHSFETTNKKVDQRAANGLVKLTRKSRWEGNALVSQVELENGLKAEQRYEVITDGLQLRVTTTIQGAGGGKNKRTLTHTYERPDNGSSHP